MSDVAETQVAVVPGPTWELVWRAIAERGVRVRFAPGEVLMHHGATGRTCFAIESGAVLATATSTQGAELVLSRRSSGELVGELAALEGAPRSATVIAKTEVSAFKLRSEQLHDLLVEYPEWAVALLRHLAGRLRTLSERYALRSEDLRSRIGELLATNMEETGDPAFRSTRSELASWVGATREATIRVLQEMGREGLVELQRGAVVVLDAGRIRG
jgi:CRP/FNR family cyclic AMP-dependent transcriptional regulator